MEQESYCHGNVFLKKAKPGHNRLKFIDSSSYKDFNVLKAV